MITSVDFICRAFFEDRYPRPWEAAISIGDHDQKPPGVLHGYRHALRLQFLDVEPEECRKHDIPHEKTFQSKQAMKVAAFIRTLHDLPDKIDVVVHCEAGISRSAAVASAVEAYSRCDRKERDACYANKHVVRLLENELGVQISIPNPPAQDDEAP